MPHYGLQGKVVLVTGGNNPHGIGAATARAFAAEGAKVFIHFLATPHAGGEGEDGPGEHFYLAQQAKSADDVVTAIRRDGGVAESRAADLGDPANVPSLFNAAEQSLGPVDVLVNNAAHCVPDTFTPAALLGNDARAVDSFPLGPICVESIERHFAVNSHAPALLMAEFASRHARRGATWGRIVNVSTDGASGFTTSVSYGASKHALESFSRAAAGELGPLGITVNVVSLGPIQTGWISPEIERREAAKTPLGRIGRPEDVADVVVFLASQQARWLTGQLIYVGGGRCMPQ